MTVNAAELLIAPEEAVIVAVPCATLVASPVPVIVATEEFEEVQLAVVRFWVVPLLYVPVAVNCCVSPAATDAALGAIDIEVKTAAVTVSVAEPLMVPKVAVMVADP